MRAWRKNVYPRLTCTDMHATIRRTTARGEHRRRARRRRQRRQSRAQRTRGCRQVARRTCRAGSRAGDTCRASAHMQTTIRGRRRTTTATAAIIEPTRLEAMVAPAARPATGARAWISKSMIWDASTARAGSEDRAGQSRRAAELPARARTERASRPAASERSAWRRRWEAAHAEKLSSMPELR